MKNLRAIHLVLLCIMLTISACGSNKDIAATPSVASETVSPDASPSPEASSSAMEMAEDMPSASASASASANGHDEHAMESASAEPEPSESQTEPSVEPSKKPSASAKPSAEPSEKPSEEPSKEPSAEPSKEPSAEPTHEDHQETVVVEIKDFAYSPSEITIHKGTTVKFINRDKVKHTATADGGEFDTGLLGKDVSGEVKFDDVGTFTYYCAPHPGMTAKIVVEE